MIHSALVFFNVFNHGLQAGIAGGGVGESLGAGSPFTSYTAAAVVYVLIASVLITGLLLGAFLIINLGLLSKRQEDRVGHRDPSDLGILKTGLWPEEPEDTAVLPAEESEEILVASQVISEKLEASKGAVRGEFQRKQSEKGQEKRTA